MYTDTIQEELLYDSQVPLWSGLVSAAGLFREQIDLFLQKDQVEAGGIQRVAFGAGNCGRRKPFKGNCYKLKLSGALSLEFLEFPEIRKNRLQDVSGRIFQIGHLQIGIGFL